MSLIFGGHFKLLKRVGAGSFGEVFEAEEIKTHEIVGLKLEPKRTESPQLEHESEVYKDLQDGINFPRLYSFEKEEKFNFISMELLGKSLDELFHICQCKFTLKTVLFIIDQTLNAIEFVHKMHYIYCDIKPNNFLIGRDDNSNQIFLIDFGLSKKYIDETTGEHIPYREDQSIIGTARYASANALQGNQQSRKDDLIALGYMWVYFLKGTLPWVGLEKCDYGVGSHGHANYDEVISLKKYMRHEQLCKDLPNQFVKYFNAVNDLKFDEEPKYSEYRLMFRKLFLLCQFSYDYKFDWSGNPLAEPPASPRNVGSLQGSRAKSSRGVPAIAQRLCPLSPSNQKITLPLSMHRKKRRSSISDQNPDIIEINSPRSGRQIHVNRGSRKTNSQLLHANDDELDYDQPSSPRLKNIKCRSPGSPTDESTAARNEKVRISPPIPRPRGKVSPRQSKSMLPAQSLASELEEAEREQTILGPVKVPSLSSSKTSSKNVTIVPVIPFPRVKSSKGKFMSPRRNTFNSCDLSPEI